MPPSPAARASAETSFEPDLGIGMGLRAGENVEREGQQPVAGQDGGRLVERLVRGRAAAPQVVVVHGRQVVVRERIAMHAFERRRRHQRMLARARRTARRIPPPGTGASACRRRGSHSAWPRAAAPAARARRRPGPAPAVGRAALRCRGRPGRADPGRPPRRPRLSSQHQCGPCFPPARAAIYQGAPVRPTFPSPIH